MGDIIRLPRPNPGRRWSPVEILAIKDEPDEKIRQSRERSRVATRQKIASTTNERKSRRAAKKRVIITILDSGLPYTVARMTQLVGDRIGETISPTTVTRLLKELEAEGQAVVGYRLWRKSNN